MSYQSSDVDETYSYEHIRRYLITSIRCAGSLPLTPGLTVIPFSGLCLGAGDSSIVRDPGRANVPLAREDEPHESVKFFQKKTYLYATQ
jgi:hypothetical protein